jgi:phosphoribosyl-ATP pyrophosphohydrolase
MEKNMSENTGYHIRNIKKGSIGEISKIQEELEELLDAKEQGSKIMELVELSDLIGAVELYLEKYHPDIDIQDLIKMSNITKRAFKNGHR